MALALDCSVGGLVSLPTIRLNGTWAWEFEVDVPNTTNQRVINFNESDFRYLKADSGLWELRNGSAGLPTVSSSTPVVVGARTVIRVEATDSLVSWSIDGGALEEVGPQTNYFELGDINFKNLFTGKVYRNQVWQNGVLTHSFIKSSTSGNPDIEYTETVSGAHGQLSGFPSNNDHWIYYDDGSEPEPELHEFSGNAIVSALSFAQISKITQHNGQALITASAAASSTKVISVSGGSTVIAQSVSLFEKLNTFNGAASVVATSQSSASKLVPFNGQATVSVTANASIIDGDLEIHSFSGGALITASASGQAMKVGIVSGSVNVTASISAQASKTALLSGNATVSTSTQSLLSKIANITGNAITRVTTLAAVLKRVTLSGASRVVATASGTFFNAESNLETYELTVQGRVKAPIVVQGTVKSLTIQGRVK